jgi:hypothetical protein
VRFEALRFSVPYHPAVADSTVAWQIAAPLSSDSIETSNFLSPKPDLRTQELNPRTPDATRRVLFGIVHTVSFMRIGRPVRLSHKKENGSDRPIYEPGHSNRLRQMGAL